MFDDKDYKNMKLSTIHDFQNVDLSNIDMHNCIWTNRPEPPKCKFKYECFEDDKCPYNVENCQFRPINVKSMLY